MPALGYLEQYRRLVKKSAEGTITPAEMIVMTEFDQAELYQYEQARELSVSLLKEWLVAYKFKNWKTTETRRVRVTSQMRKRRAISIARTLNNTGRWHSHGQGISMTVLRRELNLKIIDLEDSNLAPADCHRLIREYDGLLSDYMSKTRKSGMVHIVGRFVPYLIG